MHAEHTSLLAVVIALPLLGALFNGLTGRKLKNDTLVHSVALAAVAIPAVLAWVLFFQLLGMDEHGRALHQTLFPWIHVGSFQIDFGLWLDPLSAVMLLIITNVGALIHLYSIGYMKGDGSYYRYFAYLNLFIFAMLCLVLGDNLVVLFLGWEGVGLASYLLIGFWFEDRANAKAGKKAFITNRVGDFGFALGMFALFVMFGTLTPVGDGGINAQLAANAGAFDSTWIEVAALLLFVGACGKSAQIPLYVWLPDAMAGPTPVSALIHAATMVTAGVYMIARLNGLFFAAEFASSIILYVGAFTALFAATIGLVQNDIKKVLAYSTVSQLGFMFTAMGAGAYAIGVFHLMTHAFFKACLFLGSGSVIAAMHHEQDMRYYGGLRKFMPITHLTFLAATLAIAGFPFMAGFMSKDEILWWAFASERGSTFAYILVLLAAFCTAFYMFRIMWMTFWGEHRGAPEGHGHGDEHEGDDSHDHADDHGHGHGHHGDPVESPWTMTVPLIVLGALSVVGGLLSIPPIFTGHETIHFSLHHWLHPVLANSEVHLAEAYAHSGALEWGLMALSVSVGFAAFLATYLLYKGKDKLYDIFSAKTPGLHNVLWNKWFVDEIYEGALINPLVLFSREGLWRIVDEVVIDGIVNLVADMGKITAINVGRLHSGDLRASAGVMVLGLALIMVAAVAFGIIEVDLSAITSLFEGGDASDGVSSLMGGE
ncbi:MAG: NADH-quinone oxidoreductase subunit L [Deltaproteobacteria bacterium]|nr:NADH-quinone oxidoreductase subunit L [Deltaproteobacteria bacterium]